MRKVSVLVLLGLSIITAHSQAPALNQPEHIATVVEPEPYGKVSMADLELTSCEFEKDANAEILFDKGVMLATGGLNTEHHIRIKIFNNSAEKEANIRLFYGTEIGGMGIGDLEAETINLVGGKAVVSEVVKKSVFIEKINKQVSAVVFTFPDVRPGSVIEYKYKSDFNSTWYFQHRLPTRYSEIEMDYLDRRELRYVPFIKSPPEKRISSKSNGIVTIALTDIHSLPVEPYMSSIKDNSERVEFYSTNVRMNSWKEVVLNLSMFRSFTNALYGSLPGETAIKKYVRGLRSTDEKIAYIFDTVRNAMKWNGITSFYSRNEIDRSWSQKTGNSGEINLVLYHLLKITDVKAVPMLISTREHGKILPANPDPNSFNNMVVYVPIDSTKGYVLDAANKFNQFNTVPFDDLNTYGLTLDFDQEKYSLIPMANENATMQTLFVNANIQADGKVTGTAEITNERYGKMSAVNRFKTFGEEAYRTYLQKGGDNVKISGLKMENMESDTLPLIQHIDFNADLPGTDENYIYFKPNLFSQIEDNPFQSENRYSDIDLGYCNNYSITCTYKVPAGYKVDALAKSVTIVMPDQSIVCKRMVAEDNGTILLRYTINHKKTEYPLEEYQDIRGFYKKMYDLLNEQISLKRI